MSLELRDILPEDASWVQGVLTRYWASTRIVTRGRVHRADRLPGLVAVRRQSRVGLLTYDSEGDQWEIVSLNALREGQGIGIALVRELKRRAQGAGCRRIWLITTNDNLPAMRFYEHIGFQRVAIHDNAIELSRRLKPEIPAIGIDGVPIQHEMEYELGLKQPSRTKRGTDVGESSTGEEREAAMQLRRLNELKETEAVPGFHGRFVHSSSMTLANWRVEQGAVAPAHSHPHEQIVCVIEGRFELEVGGQLEIMEAGAFAVIPSNVTHGGRALTDCRLIDLFHPAREDLRFDD